MLSVVTLSVILTNVVAPTAHLFIILCVTTNENTDQKFFRQSLKKINYGRVRVFQDLVLPCEHSISRPFVSGFLHLPSKVKNWQGLVKITCSRQSKDLGLQDRVSKTFHKRCLHSGENRAELDIKKLKSTLA